MSQIGGVIELPSANRHFANMRHALLTLGLIIASAPVQATCYADYKAKRDNPLRLHYGVVQVSDAACNDRTRAASEARARVEANGWSFLNLVSVFGEEGLAGRKKSAGEYYLRF